MRPVRMKTGAARGTNNLLRRRWLDDFDGVLAVRALDVHGTPEYDFFYPKRKHRLADCLSAMLRTKNGQVRPSVLTL